MGFKVFMHPKADKFLNKLDKQLKDQIKSKLKTLKNEPDFKGERLKHSDFFRIRIRDYRAIYEILHDKNQVLVLSIGHRKNVYDDFSKLLL